jgi:uncharacterized protein YoxC
VKQTEQKLKTLNEEIRERSDYLRQINADIEAVTEAGNNQLLLIRAEIEGLEREKAGLLKRNLQLDQQIREKSTLI